MFYGFFSVGIAEKNVGVFFLSVKKVRKTKKIAKNTIYYHNMPFKRLIYFSCNAIISLIKGFTPVNERRFAAANRV